MTESRISKQPIKKETLTPRRQLIEQAKQVFLEELSGNGGNVSKALMVACITRKTLYDHRYKDRRFRTAWLQVLEAVNDAVVDEIRRRGVDGVEKPVFRNGNLVGSSREYSDTLLIYLHKQTEHRKMWRSTLVDAANTANEEIKVTGAKIGLSKQQIEILQNAILKSYGKVIFPLGL